ncbi:hypothetical protein JSO61_007330 [Riemerella anatipestifer]|uniref:hypothetical protein n=1 Tax=Riemerella anatipestifer TaxID=34085 RepID=UPI0012ADE122|nr:hypothetical protein [Riemerella anatipestifer]MDY3363741.1 hypothetical protein [Riemerella anatipestifer]MDY3520398.1 hypothetical protein [Riemerella anatipestifer]MDY3533377.1 hypothetical protein [Riemerella anatipestifer]MDY3534362.1 hypothetical protein [Riemerella anatipestifer]USL94880.1 hypothetical protein D1J36_006140 [Riemerella anatipestifer]
MKKILLMSIFTVGVFSMESCREADELNISEIYESNNTKVMDGKFTVSIKNNSTKEGEHPKDPVKWGVVVQDSIKIKK